jgi:hypothetical protein
MLLGYGVVILIALWFVAIGLLGVFTNAILGGGKHDGWLAVVPISIGLAIVYFLFAYGPISMSLEMIVK